MTAILRIRRVGLVVCLSALAAAVLSAETPTPQGVEFFETKIRPVLVRDCYKCHAADAKSPKGGLLLDTRAGLRAGGESGHAVVPNNVEESLIIDALRHDSFEMPPSGKLPNGVIDDFVRWIEMGAPDPRDGKLKSTVGSIDLEAGRKYWAYQPIRDVPTPDVQDVSWPRQELDYFVLSRLEAEGLQPAADASPATLLRRSTYDLAGLPPTPEEITAFEDDTESDAFDRVIDGLLAAERFGERWGRHWLDVARYAESMGRTRNYPLPYAWRYRNWVIDAINADKPYDAFVREQIAGDLLDLQDTSEREAALIATGFLALGSHDLNERNLAKFRMDVADEQINVVMRAVLATTAGCARCHDHKFDPIPTNDYYALAGIFHSSKLLVGYQGKNKGKDVATDLLVALSGDETVDRQLIKQHERQKAKVAKEVAELRAEMQRLKKLAGGKRKNKKASDSEDANAISAGEARQILNKTRRALKQKTNRLKQLEQSAPRGLNYAMAVCDEDKPSNCRIHIRGDTSNLGVEVTRGFLQVLDSEHGAQEFKGSGRLELAEWLTDANTPVGALAARVMVNRVWHHLFGQGLVRTVDNFGTTGDAPSHPELLEHLAGYLVRENWSLKQLIRYVVSSHTYQLGSDFVAASYESDPENRLMWRMSPRRLEVEALRDALLLIGGNLETERPDNSPMMSVRSGEMSFGAIDKALQQNCRSVYLPLARGFVPSMFSTFDFAEPSEPKGRRDVTTVAPQALFMMNSEFVIKQSRDAASELLAAEYASDEERLRAAYLNSLGRLPSEAEVAQAVAYLEERHRGVILKNTVPAAKAAEHEAWSSLYQALFACAEFRYVY